MQLQSDSYWNIGVVASSDSLTFAKEGWLSKNLRLIRRFKKIFLSQFLKICAYLFISLMHVVSNQVSLFSKQRLFKRFGLFFFSWWMCQRSVFYKTCVCFNLLFWLWVVYYPDRPSKIEYLLKNSYVYGWVHILEWFRIYK